MKKIHLGKILNTKKAYCDFCKDEEEKECVESYIEDWYTDKKTEFKSSFFVDFREEVVGFDINKRKTNIHICHDCIKQINELI